MNKKNNFLYYYVYLTKNMLNNKCYVGWHATNKLYDNYIGSGQYFQKAVNKYGKENFVNGIIEFCSEEDVLQREIYWIEKMKTLQPNGYNLTIGGEGCIGYKHTENTKQKFSLRKISDDHKQKIRNSQIGNKNRFEKCFTQEQKDKISITLSNKFDNKNELIKQMYLDGKNFSDIVKNLKCSTKTITKVLKNSNIKKRSWNSYSEMSPKTKEILSKSHLKNSEEKWNNIRKLYLDGETTTNISKILKTSPNTIAKALKNIEKHKWKK
jgi:group I intron endonuclease